MKTTFEIGYNMLKKCDFIFFASIILIAAGLLVLNSKVLSDSRMASIYIDNQLHRQVSLDENREIEIDADGVHMTLIVENNSISVDKSVCRHGVCIATGGISQNMQCIICLPQKVLIVLDE